MSGTIAELLVLTATLPPALGFLQSYIFEVVPFFKGLTAAKKRGIVTIVSIALALGLFAIGEFVPESVINDLDPWYAVIFTAIQIATAQYSHGKVKIDVTK